MTQTDSDTEAPHRRSHGRESEMEAKSGEVELTSANRDCLAKARPGEPMFIILGRDPDGGNIVRLWAERRNAAGDNDHAGPVFAIADEMDAYASDPANAPESAPAVEAYPQMVNVELLAVLEELVRRTPYVPHADGIQLVITFDQMKRQQAALRYALGLKS